MPFLCVLLIVVLVVVLVVFLLFLLFVLFWRFLFLLLFFVFFTADQLFNKFSKLHLRRNGPSVPLRREKEWVILELWTESPTRKEIQVLASRRLSVVSAIWNSCCDFFKPEWISREDKRGEKTNCHKISISKKKYGESFKAGLFWPVKKPVVWPRPKGRPQGEKKNNGEIWYNFTWMSAVPLGNG